MLSSPRRGVPLATQVAAQFRALIAAGDWPVGGRIPPEHRLTEELGVSRNTVREALSALVHLGLLEARPVTGPMCGPTASCRSRSGDASRPPTRTTHWRSAPCSSTAAPDGPPCTPPPRTWPAARAPGAPRRRRAAGDLPGFVEADFAFHRAVVIAGGNPLLAELYQHLSPVITQTINDTAALHEDRAVHELHHRLVDAIAAGDPAAAEACSVALVDEGRDILHGSPS